MPTIARRLSLLLFIVSIISWTAAGPARAGQGVWTAVAPATHWYSGQSITVHPRDPGSVWAGNFFRSWDYGRTWRWAGGSTLGQAAGPFAVAADSSMPGALWAAARTGFFRTEDGGAGWVRLSGDDWPAILGPEEAPSQLVPVPGALYLVTGRRLAASTDNGRSWTVLQDLEGHGAIRCFAVHPKAPAALYLATFGPDGPALLQSLDRGHTWAAVTSLPLPPEGITQMAASPGAVYVATEGVDAGLWRSSDRGLTWRRLFGASGQPFYLRSLVIDSQAPWTVYVSGIFASPWEPGLWISRNAGTSWTKAADRSFDSLQIDSATRTWYGFTDRSLLRSRDAGATWTEILRVPDTESSFARIGFQSGAPAQGILSAGFTLYRSFNAGRSWKLLGSPPGVRDVDIDPADLSRLIAVSFSAAYLSENAGKTWTKAGGSFDYVEQLVRVDEHTLIAGGAGLYRSGDDGRSWQTVLPGWPRGAQTGRWAQEIEVDPSRPSTIYALTFLAEVVEPPHDELSDLPSILWKSTDGGLTWRKMTLNLRTFAIDPGTSRLYGIRNRQILASGDGGKSWQSIGQTPGLVHELVIDPVDSNVFYTAGAALSRSRDRGATWEVVTDAWRPLTLEFSPDNPRILYGADRWGVFQIRLPD